MYSVMINNILSNQSDKRLHQGYFPVLIWAFNPHAIYVLGKFLLNLNNHYLQIQIMHKIAHLLNNIPINKASFLKFRATEILSEDEYTLVKLANLSSTRRGSD